MKLNILESFYNYLKYNEDLFIFKTKSKYSSIEKKFKLLKHELIKHDFNKILIDKIELNGYTLDIKQKDKNKLINLLENQLYQIEFEPKTSKDFALIHDTHSNNKNNEKETNIFIKRIFDGNFVENNIEILIAKNNINYKKDNVDYLIIVENYKIFELNDLYTYFKQFNFKEYQYLISQNTNKIKIMYGSGNKINSFRLLNYFKQYKKIFYFGDYDDEGYKIFKTFFINNSNVEFVLPFNKIIKNIQMKMEKIPRKLKNSKKDVNIFIKDKELIGLIDIDMKNRYLYEMQQEVFINK
jgi:hypothetical protein